MNLIFKIVEYLEETDQIIIKFSRQNSPKPIDEYPPVAIDCCNIDQSDYHQFVCSIMRYGIDIVLKQEEEEPTLLENVPSELLESTNAKDHVNRIISLSAMELVASSYRMNKIKLD
jgi:hypothetical protein